MFPDAEKHLYDFYCLLALVDEVTSKFNGAELTIEQDDALRAAEYAGKIEEEFNACMSDDFNTALALSNLFGYFKEIKKLTAAKDEKAAAYAKQIRDTYALLGFFQKDAAAYVAARTPKEDIPAEVKAVAEERWTARLNRDWAKSDELRNKLAELGYAVKDSKTGYELTKI